MKQCITCKTLVGDNGGRCDSCMWRRRTSWVAFMAAQVAEAGDDRWIDKAAIIADAALAEYDARVKDGRL